MAFPSGILVLIVDSKNLNIWDKLSDYMNPYASLLEIPHDEKWLDYDAEERSYDYEEVEYFHDETQTTKIHIRPNRLFEWYRFYIMRNLNLTHLVIEDNDDILIIEKNNRQDFEKAIKVKYSSLKAGNYPDHDLIGYPSKQADVWSIMSEDLPKDGQLLVMKKDFELLSLKENEGEDLELEADDFLIFLELSGHW